VFFDVHGSYPERGDCHRYPPVKETDSETGHFPWVSANNFCGEYQRFDPTEIAERIPPPSKDER